MKFYKLKKVLYIVVILIGVLITSLTLVKMNDNIKIVNDNVEKKMKEANSGLAAFYTYRNDKEGQIANNNNIKATGDSEISLIKSRSYTVVFITVVITVILLFGISKITFKDKSKDELKIRLAQLKELYDENIITEDEYNKKREIIISSFNI